MQSFPPRPHENPAGLNKYRRRAGMQEVKISRFSSKLGSFGRFVGEQRINTTTLARNWSQPPKMAPGVGSGAWSRFLPIYRLFGPLQYPSSSPLFHQLCSTLHYRHLSVAHNVLQHLRNTCRQVQTLYARHRVLVVD